NVYGRSAYARDGIRSQYGCRKAGGNRGWRASAGASAPGRQPEGAPIYRLVIREIHVRQLAGQCLGQAAEALVAVLIAGERVRLRHPPLLTRSLMRDVAPGEIAGRDARKEGRAQRRGIRMPEEVHWNAEDIGTDLADPVRLQHSAGGHQPA